MIVYGSRSVEIHLSENGPNVPNESESHLTKNCSGRAFRGVLRNLNFRQET